MKLFFTLVFFSIFSSSVFACKVITEMEASRLFINGLSNKLSTIPNKKDSTITAIKFLEFPNTYEVNLLDVETEKCSVLKMRSYGTGSCEFTADILEESAVSCN